MLSLPLVIALASISNVSPTEGLQSRELASAPARSIYRAIDLFDQQPVANARVLVWRGGLRLQIVDANGVGNESNSQVPLAVFSPGYWPSIWPFVRSQSDQFILLVPRTHVVVGTLVEGANGGARLAVGHNLREPDNALRQCLDSITTQEGVAWELFEIIESTEPATFLAASSDWSGRIEVGASQIQPQLWKNPSPCTVRVQVLPDSDRIAQVQIGGIGAYKYSKTWDGSRPPLWSSVEQPVLPQGCAVEVVAFFQSAQETTLRREVRLEGSSVVIAFGAGLEEIDSSEKPILTSKLLLIGGPPGGWNELLQEFGYAATELAVVQEIYDREEIWTSRARTSGNSDTLLFEYIGGIPMPVNLMLRGSKLGARLPGNPIWKFAASDLRQILSSYAELVVFVTNLPHNGDTLVVRAIDLNGKVVGGAYAEPWGIPIHLPQGTYRVVLEGTLGRGLIASCLVAVGPQDSQEVVLDAQGRTTLRLECDATFARLHDWFLLLPRGQWLDMTCGPPGAGGHPIAVSAGEWTIACSTAATLHSGEVEYWLAPITLSPGEEAVVHSSDILSANLASLSVRSLAYQSPRATLYLRSKGPGPSFVEAELPPAPLVRINLPEGEYVVGNLRNGGPQGKLVQISLSAGRITQLSL